MIVICLPGCGVFSGVGKARDVGNVDYIDACFAQRFRRAAGAEDLNAETFQLLREIHNSCLVGNTNQRTTNLAQAGVGFFSHRRV